MANAIINTTPDIDMAGMMMTQGFEGWRDKPYKDPGGKNTSIGYGFNIDNPTVKKMLPSAMVNGRLDKTKAKEIFKVLYGQAKKEAQLFVGDKVYSKLSDAKKNVLHDMAYNLGANLNGFKGFKKAMISGDYKRAAAEMRYINPDADIKQENPWYKKTGKRARNHILQIQQ